MINNSKHVPTLSVSVVIYKTDSAILLSGLRSLLGAIAVAVAAGELQSARVDIINNADADPVLSAMVGQLAAEAAAQSVEVRLLEGHGNVGYGRGHNLSISAANTDYHLILNPDVTLAQDALGLGLHYMMQNPAVAALSPAVRDGEGHKQYVCKRFPSVLDFLLRGFAPAVVKRAFNKRLANYEMRELSEQEPSTGIPIISGCFMLFRTSVLRSVGGFDARYFLYFEDFDLSLRVHGKGALAYLPAMHITHLGGDSASKGLRHIGMFVRSGILFYNTHGWRFL
ncbi:MAG: glycosyltransferase [Gammaproteobacteria bacterium]|nr:glycosyltransferase [Gammaproteobacteria bacterium]